MYNLGEIQKHLFMVSGHALLSEPLSMHAVFWEQHGALARADK